MSSPAPRPSATLAQDSLTSDMTAEPLPPLPRIPYLRLRCTLRAEAPARLPPYHGSTLRGGFGRGREPRAEVNHFSQPRRGDSGNSFAMQARVIR